jgi:hypothetical protein
MVKIMRRHSSHLRVALLASAFISALAGCGDPAPTAGTVSSITGASIVANPNNVVSAIAVVRTAHAERVMVEYGTDTLFASHTREVPVVGDSATIPILPLHAATSYRMRIVAIDAGGAKARANELDFTTGPLPSDIPKYTVTSGANAAPGFVMFAVTSGNPSLGGFYALVVDNSGAPVWYRKFGSQITDFQRQPNGNFTIYSSFGSEPRHFYELDPLGDVVGEYSVAGVETGAHELRLRENGYLIFGVPDSVMDLTSAGGRANEKVKGQAIEYHRGAEIFRWNTFDHLTVDEMAPDFAIDAANIDPWHLNAVEIDTDDNLLASFRNSDEVLKIDSHTGAIIWRLGGKKNQFTFINDPLGGFTHQHGVRRLANGDIILFDNGNLHTPQMSRAAEYRLDEHAMSAELVWEYRNNPSLFSNALGFAQRLPGGNTLVCFGTTGHIVEADPSGAKQWELALANPGYFIYRAFRIDGVE